VSVSIDCPGFPFGLPSLRVLILNTWVRNNRCVVYCKEDLLASLPQRLRTHVIRHGVRTNGVLCVSIAFDVFIALLIAGEGGKVLPMLADGIAAHNGLVNETKDFSGGDHRHAVLRT